MPTSARQRPFPVPIVAALAGSALALFAGWFAPLAGVAIAAVIVLAGVALLVNGRRAIGAVVVVLPFAVTILALRVVGLLFFKPYRIPSEAMAPTIGIGDRVLATRGGGAPSIGDTVIAHPPGGALDNRCGARKPDRTACARPTAGLADVKFIKRVVAGPGDRIAFRRGLLIRNGKPAREPYAEPCDEDVLCDLPNPITVPAGTWFLVGDNRGSSADSRVWGPAPTAAIIGTVTYRYWPLREAGRI
jgi:signal peptidase I